MFSVYIKKGVCSRTHTTFVAVVLCHHGHNFTIRHDTIYFLSGGVTLSVSEQHICISGGKCKYQCLKEKENLISLSALEVFKDICLFQKLANERERLQRPDSSSSKLI